MSLKTLHSFCFLNFTRLCIISKADNIYALVILYLYKKNLMWHRVFKKNLHSFWFLNFTLICITFHQFQSKNFRIYMLLNPWRGIKILALELSVFRSLNLVLCLKNVINYFRKLIKFTGRIVLFIRWSINFIASKLFIYKNFQWSLNFTPEKLFINFRLHFWKLRRRTLKICLKWFIISKLFSNLYYIVSIFNQ